MSRRSLGVALALITIGAAIGPAHADRPEPLRVLFVGNSYTRFNDLPRMVRRISREVPEGRPVRTTRLTEPGFSLRRHWERPEARAAIESDAYDLVVLQGNSLSPIEAPGELREYANRFAALATTHQARVVLFETWARHEDHLLYRRRAELDGPDAMLARIEQVYLRLGEELHASVAPVGRAWLAARRALPRARLHRADGTHPSVAGTYLSACVLYATLTTNDPRQTSWRPTPLGRRRAVQLRELAANAVTAPEPPAVHDPGLAEPESSATLEP